MSCAIELLDAALARAEGNSYEALIALEGGAPEDADGGAERAIGYACYGATPMTDGTYDLYWLVVGVDARGRGVGSALLAATEDHLRRRGARLIRIETSSLEGEGGAARFYARSGYGRVGVIPAFYRPGDDLLIFAKPL